MKINDVPTRTIRATPDATAVEIIDQTALPHAYRTLRLESLEVPRMRSAACRFAAHR